MKNISNNLYSRNLYEKTQINQNNQPKQMKNKSTKEVYIRELPNEGLVTLDKMQNEVVKSFLNRIQKEIKKAQLIAINMVKGSVITKEDLDFINKKYPNIKEVADELISKCDSFKLQLRNCITEKEIQKIMDSAIKGIKEVTIKGMNSEFQAKINTSALEEITCFSKKVHQEIKKIEELAKEEKKFINKNEIRSNLNPYILLNSILSLNKGTMVIGIISVISILYILGKIIS